MAAADGTWKITINTPMGAQEVTAEITTSGDTFTGWTSQPTSYTLAATIDDVAIYPTALTAAQIAAHYNAGKNGTTPANVAPTNIALRARPRSHPASRTKKRASAG